MGVDVEFILVVKDDKFLPTKEQIYAVFELYDKYNITEFGLPPANDREDFLLEINRQNLSNIACHIMRDLAWQARPCTKSMGWGGRWKAKEDKTHPENVDVEKARTAILRYNQRQLEGRTKHPHPPLDIDKAMTAVQQKNKKLEERRSQRLTYTNKDQAKVTSICEQFGIGIVAAYSCLKIEQQNWTTEKMDIELELPIRKNLHQELIQEFYYNNEHLKQRVKDPDDLCILSDNDVVLRVLPEPLRSPYGDYEEKSGPPEYRSRVLLLQQDFGRPSTDYLWEFIRFFKEKYPLMLKDAAQIVKRDIIPCEFLS